MNNYFSIGELSKYQNISTQTLIYYDKIGLFKPSYVDEKNGYRYYSAEQLDYLDTILIMKTIGFSLSEIKNYMNNNSMKHSLYLLKNQVDVITHKIKELSIIRNRLEHRIFDLEQTISIQDPNPSISTIKEQYLLYHEVNKPYTMCDISIATKKCYTQALNNNIPIFFQCGVSVPLKKIRNHHSTEANLAFVSTDYIDGVSNIMKLPKGLTTSIYHFGNYQTIDASYRKLIDFCDQHHFEIISDSYEFCINDYITSKDENEFITKIIFYIK